MKKFDTGLVIGKFLPFHKGHHSLMEFAQKRSKHLIIIVCHTKDYSISPHLRKSWIENKFPQADVRIFRHATYLDDDSPDSSQIWADVTVSFLGSPPDAVFTSESYGPPYAKHMGSKHIMFDQARKKVPISASKIRNNPFRHWEMINEDVRAYFAKRVVVLGAESTGTTTLAKDLATHYKTAWVPEYGRFYYEGRQPSTYQDWNTDEFVHIAKQQNQMEDHLAKKANKILICDTDSFTTSVWHQRYIQQSSDKVLSISKDRDYDLYILTAPDIPFDQDGTRDGEHLRNWMHDVFIKELKKTNKKFIIVKGSKKKRLKKSIRHIDFLFS